MKLFLSYWLATIVAVFLCGSTAYPFSSWKSITDNLSLKSLSPFDSLWRKDADMALFAHKSDDSTTLFASWNAFFWSSDEGSNPRVQEYQFSNQADETFSSSSSLNVAGFMDFDPKTAAFEAHNRAKRKIAQKSDWLNL